MSGNTIKDVARLAQVSVGTASMALNGKQGVNEETRKKVMEAARTLNYKPSPYARYLSSKKTNLIGLIVTDITNPFFGILIDLIQKGLNKYGYDVMLGISRGSIAEEKRIVQKFIDMQVEGVLAVPSHNPAPDTLHYNDLQKSKIPVCFITSYYPGINAPCVMTDLSDGAYQLTKYLLQNGHRQIIYIVGDLSVPVSSLRVEGYISAYRDLGLAHQPDWIFSTDVTLEAAYSTTELVLQQFQPDAIITINDFMAMGVLKCLKEHNLNVPQDISVAGYDDIIYSSMLETSLTTVRQPLEQICQRTISMFLKQLNLPDAADMITEKILLKPNLIIRSSSKPH